MKNAFQEVSLDILKLFLTVLKSDVGINRKVGKNTLAKSRLAKTATVDATDIPFIKLSLNDYVEQIENGRRPKAQLVSIEALRDWAQRKGIKSDNTTLMRIQYGIWRDGISKRPILTIFYDLLDKEWNDTYADMLFQAITNNLDKYFNE